MVFLNQSCRQAIPPYVQSDNLTVNDSSTYIGGDVHSYNNIDSFLCSYFFPKDSMIKRNYSAILSKYENKYVLKHSLSLLEIEEIVPRTRQEYIIYYDSYRNEKESNEIDMPFFHYIDHAIYKNAFNSDTNFICIALNFARFFDLIATDNEFAQLHWDMTQDLINDNMFIYQRIICLFKNDKQTIRIYKDFVF